MDMDFSDLEKKAMEIMGYIVIAKDGYIIRRNADGTEIRLKQIEHRSNS